MRPSSRAWAAFLLLYGALLAWQTNRWFLTPHGLVSSWAHRQDGLSASAGSPRGLTQTFVMGADGLDGVWLRPVFGGPTRGDLLVDISEVRGEARVRLERVVVRAADASSGSLRVPFRPQRHSRGVAFELLLRHVNVGDGAPLSFAVTRDDRVPRGRLFVDGEEQWGDLVFETTASRATLPYWLHEILGPWPAWMRAWPTVMAVLALFNLVLAWSCALAVGLWPQRVIPADEASGTATPRDAARAVHRTARAATVLVVAGGCLVALWPTPSRGRLDLIEALPDARIETTWPSLHDGVSRQTVVFFGRVYPAIIAMPTSRIAWTVEVPPDAMLRVGAAMRADLWGAESDGIQMHAAVEHAGGRTDVAALTLFPLMLVEHRRLVPIDVSLQPWAGQRVRIVLESTPERWGNAVNDVPVWTEPRIEWPRRPGSPGARVVRER